MQDNKEFRLSGQERKERKRVNIKSNEQKE
jgi:hypothetical protein